MGPIYNTFSTGPHKITTLKNWHTAIPIAHTLLALAWENEKESINQARM